MAYLSYRTLPEGLKDWVPVLSASSGDYLSTSILWARWKRVGDMAYHECAVTGTTSGGVNFLNYTLPFTPTNSNTSFAVIRIDGDVQSGNALSSAANIRVYPASDASNWGDGAGRIFRVSGWCEV